MLNNATVILIEYRLDFKLIMPCIMQSEYEALLIVFLLLQLSTLVTVGRGRRLRHSLGSLTTTEPSSGTLREPVFCTHCTNNPQCTCSATRAAATVSLATGPASPSLLYSTLYHQLLGSVQQSLLIKLYPNRLLKDPIILACTNSTISLTIPKSSFSL